MVCARPPPGAGQWAGRAWMWLSRIPFGSSLKHTFRLVPSNLGARKCARTIYIFHMMPPAFAPAQGVPATGREACFDFLGRAFVVG